MYDQPETHKIIGSTYAYALRQECYSIVTN